MEAEEDVGEDGVGEGVWVGFEALGGELAIDDEAADAVHCGPEGEREFAHGAAVEHAGESPSMPGA